MRETLADYCIRFERQDLLDQWDAEANGDLTPAGVSYGSRRKVWWRCEKGHRWEAAVYARSSGESGCPYCTGKKPWPGFNDLASRFPDVAREWHPTKNGGLTPDQVLWGSSRRVWWQCPQGHEWSAIVKSRTAGAGCPYCASRQVSPGDNDLAALYPDLAREWHPTKNAPLTPRDVVPGSRRKVWWQCAKGHEWQAAVFSRARSGAGCPACAGKTVIPGENDLATRFPRLAQEWDGTRNGALTPERVSPYSNRQAWWICERGHSWRAAISARAWGSDCPFCAGRRVLAGFNDLATLDPPVAAEWDPDLNGGLTPQMVTVGSHKKVWWRCPEGHVWKAVVYSRTGPKHCGCPVCAGKVSRRNLRGYLAPRGKRPLEVGVGARQPKQNKEESI